MHVLVIGGGRFNEQKQARELVLIGTLRGEKISHLGLGGISSLGLSWRAVSLQNKHSRIPAFLGLRANGLRSRSAMDAGQEVRPVYRMVGRLAYIWRR